MEFIKPKDFESAIETLLKNKDGAVYQKVATFDDGVDLYLVFGWGEGYDETDDAYQEKEGDRIYTICAKLAVNTDDLQCDYDIVTTGIIEQNPLCELSAKKSVMLLFFFS